MKFKWWKRDNGAGKYGVYFLLWRFDELVPGTNTLETKSTGRGFLDAVMADRKSRKCFSFIWNFFLSSVSRHLYYGWYPEQMSDGKLSFKSPSTRWHIQAKKAMPERICKQGIQTRKVKVEQLRPTEWRIIRQSFTWPIPVVEERDNSPQWAILLLYTQCPGLWIEAPI